MMDPEQFLRLLRQELMPIHKKLDDLKRESEKKKPQEPKEPKKST